MDPAHPEVVAYESTNVEAGVMGCLVESFRLTREPAFLEAAGRAAAYYGRLLDEGKLYGGPGDIEALVNSEVPMWYLRGFLRLWQATGDEGHRRWALASAAWRFAFQFSHSWPVDFGSPLYRQGWSGVGGEGASASNLHMVAFGAMNLEDYQALYLATGDPYVLDRYADLLHYATEQFARFEGDLGLPEGASCESFWASDSLFGKGYVKVFDFAGLMAWVAGFAGLGLAGHLLRERSGGDSR